MYKIFMIDFGLPVQPLIYEKEAIGGSEFSLLLLAEALAEMNHNITIFNTHDNHIINEKLMITNISYLDKLSEKPDIIIINRFFDAKFVNLLKQKYINTKFFYYCHDNFDQPNINWLMNRKNHDFFDGFLFVSQYQANVFRTLFEIPDNKIHILYNSCFKEEWTGNYEIKEYDFIFASIPHKGLYVLRDIFEEVCIRTKRDDLKFLIISDYKLYQQKNDDNYHKTISELTYTPGFIIKDIMPTIDVLNYLAKSKFYIHPSTYSETFGIIIVQAMLKQCIPIVINNGALSELIINEFNGFITSGRNILHRETFNEFVELIIKAINTDEEKLKQLRLNCEQFAMQFSNKKIANRFLNIAKGGIANVYTTI